MLEQIDNFKVEFAEEAANDETYCYISRCCDLAWHTIEKYYKLVDQTPVVHAAIMLDPRTKREWLRQAWKRPSQSKWLDEVTASVKELWRECNMPISSKIAAATADVSEADEDDLFVRLSQHKHLRLDDKTPVVDQLEECPATDLIAKSDLFDPVQYCYERRNTTSHFAKMAFDTLALPMMSDDPERSFSAGRGMITSHRSNLHGDIIQACMCLRS